MTRPSDPDRRRFLAGAGRAALGVAAGPLLLSQAGCGAGEPLVEALLAFYGDRGAAEQVGFEYLKRFPREDDVTRLVRRLAGSRARQSKWEALSADPAALAAALRARHRADFAEGRIVVLRGWVLSQTEARLCALAAKRSGRSAASGPAGAGSSGSTGGSA